MENSETLDWNSEIENDSGAFVLLDEGDYNFTVTKFARGHFNGSTKIPACNKAELTLEVKTDAGIATVRADLILARVLEWKLSSFFRCLGMKKHGEKLAMKWDQVQGKQGRAHFKQRAYVNAAGEERKANDVDYYIDYDPKFFDKPAVTEPVADVADEDFLK